MNNQNIKELNQQIENLDLKVKYLETQIERLSGTLDNKYYELKNLIQEAEAGTDYLGDELRSAIRNVENQINHY